MSHTRQTIGSIGESLVESQLLKQGWNILVKNFRGQGFEVDLIAQKGQSLIGVEVKTRHRKHCQRIRPEELIPHRKLRCINKGLRTYITKHPVNCTTIRVDLAIVWRQPLSIDYYPGIMGDN